MFVHYETQEIEAKKIIAVCVQRGTGCPYFLAGMGLKPSGVYVRNGAYSEPATDSAIRKMIQDADGDCFEQALSGTGPLLHSGCQAVFKTPCAV